jgi:hypothetical protein
MRLGDLTEGRLDGLLGETSPLPGYRATAGAMSASFG